MQSRFITLEGIDGAGKSTHLAVVRQWLAERNIRAVFTREPGGTELGERLRALLLDVKSNISLDTETLLMFAARMEHITQVIRPALQRGEWVVSDRFTDATFAYQGGGRGFDLAVLVQLEHWVQQGRQPDLTFWFDLAPEIAARRRAAARAPDRFESEDIAFFTAVRQGYALRFDATPQRVARIDAECTPEAVAAQIDAALEARGW